MIKDTDNKEQVLVSLIVPVYKVEEYLNRCVDSIVKQTYHNLEIILVDDESPDSCPAICNRWAEKDKRIKVIHKKNGGLSDARNVGVQVSSGKYICFIDSDDWISEDFVEVLANALNNGASIAECATRLFDKEDKTIRIRGSETGLINREEALSRLILEKGVFQTVCDKMYRREDIFALPFIVGKYHEDDFWSWKAFLKAETFFISEKPLYNYLQRDNGITGSAYSLKRLDGLDARYERMIGLSDLPNINTLAKLKFIDSCMYNLQCTLRFLTGEEQITAKNKIINYCKEVKLSKNDGNMMTLKSRIWQKIFLIQPILTAKIRNLIKIGF